MNSTSIQCKLSLSLFLPKTTSGLILHQWPTPFVLQGAHWVQPLEGAHPPTPAEHEPIATLSRRRLGSRRSQAGNSKTERSAISTCSDLKVFAFQPQALKSLRSPSILAPSPALAQSLSLSYLSSTLARALKLTTSGSPISASSASAQGHLHDAATESCLSDPGQSAHRHPASGTLPINPRMNGRPARCSSWNFTSQTWVT